jgi:hypothetical protein
MPAEPPPRRPRPRPPAPRPVEEPTSRMAPAPRGRHALPPAPVPPDPESTTRVPVQDPERTAMLAHVEQRAAPRDPAPRPGTRPAQDPATTAMPQVRRPDAAATTRVPVDAERTRTLGQVERTAVVPRAVPAPRPTPPAPPAPRPRPAPPRAEPARPARPPAAPPAPAEPDVPAVADAPAGSPLPGLAWRAGLVVVSVAVALLGVPAPVAAPLVAATIAVVAERVARHRRRGLLDLVLTAVAGTSAALALVGIALNVAPTGISTPGWAIGTGLLALVALACCARRPLVPGVPQMIARRRTLRPPTPLAVACVAGAVLVVAGTLVGSVLSAQADQRPPLEISAGPAVEGRIQVRIDAGATAGDYDLVLDAGGRRTTVAPGVRLAAGQVLTVPVDVPADPRALLELVAAGGTDPVRQLIVTHPQEGR